MLPAIPFHFVRHGETDWNREGRFQGRSDIPLNSRGEAQATALAPRLGAYGFRRIVASPLARARRTAEILNARLGLPIRFDDALMEFDVGPYAGLTENAWLGAWRRGQAVSGVESLDAFATRVAQGIARALQPAEATRGQEPVLIVAHGGLVWALEHLLGLPSALDIRNTALAHFRPPMGAGNWRIDILFEPV